MLQLELNSEGGLCALLPNGCRLSVPLTIKGLRVLQHILVAQIDAPASTVGSVAAPTQWQVEQWLRDHPKEDPLDLEGITL